MLALLTSGQLQMQFARRYGAVVIPPAACLMMCLVINHHVWIENDVDHYRMLAWLEKVSVQLFLKARLVLQSRVLGAANLAMS